MLLAFSKAVPISICTRLIDFCCLYVLPQIDSALRNVRVHVFSLLLRCSNPHV